MKKLMIAALAALTIGTASYALTAEEAIASKNFYVIDEYCKTNSIAATYFLFYSNKLEFAEIKDIYNSITNKKHWMRVSIVDNTSSVFSFAQAKELFDYDSSPYIYDSNSYNFIKKYGKYITEKRINVSDYEEGGRYRFNIYVFENYAIEKSTDYKSIAEISIILDNQLNTDKYRKLAKEACKSCPSALLDIAISLNDVDMIIDNLLNMDNGITAKQVENIIEPLNAVSSEYRKADILKCLNNINSWCTIRLYDDQKTWEPLLAKIRAMISVRK